MFFKCFEGVVFLFFASSIVILFNTKFTINVN